MLDNEFCRQVLKLHDPWQVEAVQVDKPSNRIDVDLGFRSGSSLFRKRRVCPRCRTPLPPPREHNRVVLRHMNFGEMRTYLSVPVMPGGDCACQRSWGKPGSRFTHEMERVIVEALRMLNSVSAVSRLLSIVPGDVREVNSRNQILETDEPHGAHAAAVAYGKAHFDDGGLEVAYIDHEAEEQPVVRAAPVAASASPANEWVPLESHPIWQRLIDEPSAVRVRALGLKMLLEQIRLTVASNPTEKSRVAGARILRQYFVKHWNRHRDELSQLLDLAAPATMTTAAAGRSESELPPENDASWQDMIDGTVVVRSDAIGLKMLLERLRQSIGGNPTPAIRLAGARILRQYFIRHSARHRTELARLQAHAGETRPPLPARTIVEVPVETARCWQLLIDGDLDIQSNAVGLTMLLERIRLTLGRSPSDPARLAAARVLRQYFEKYRTRHDRELAALERAEAKPASVGGQVVEFVEVPAENHPSWQRLINGELPMKTDALGLKMLLERVRLSLGPHPTEALRLAAARVLRQYFIKHRSRHRAELEQLKAA